MKANQRLLPVTAMGSKAPVKPGLNSISKVAPLLLTVKRLPLTYLSRRRCHAVDGRRGICARGLSMFVAACKREIRSPGGNRDTNLGGQVIDAGKCQGMIRMDFGDDAGIIAVVITGGGQVAKGFAVVNCNYLGSARAGKGKSGVCETTIWLDESPVYVNVA